MNRESDNDAGASGWSLAQLVSDPLIGLVMQSDGVERHSIELLFERLARERRCSHGDAEARALRAGLDDRPRAAAASHPCAPEYRGWRPRQDSNLRPLA